MRISQRITKLAAVYLLIVLGGDAFVVWDLVEGLGIGVHEFTSGNGVSVEVHYHNESEAKDEDHAEGGDFCVLCPCCVSNVHMVTSDFVFWMITCIDGAIEQPALRCASYVPSPTCRPPINSLS
jgi:hypothetical protein